MELSELEVAIVKRLMLLGAVTVSTGLKDSTMPANAMWELQTLNRDIAILANKIYKVQTYNHKGELH